MKENKELERGDLAIDREMEVDCDTVQEITVYVGKFRLVKVSCFLLCRYF